MAKKRPFKKILIANRGEIACRVIKSAQSMGIKTVAVYSDADADALHVRMADEAVRIGPAASSESYLVMDNIIDACKKTKAEAVHPGYGFLSENAAFVRKLQRNKIAFIGPKPRAVTAMGDKIESKKLAAKAGVNTIPGYTDAVRDDKQAVKISKEIGYPVMLKASAGGGGKGMRIARSDQEVRDGLRSAVREAISSFGDDRVFIEKFIEDPRHIEIQIMADTHGNVVYLNERECSIQRRHQKVIEEAPSPFIDEETRKAMGEQAVKLSKAVNYCSAGTVEFVVDKDRNFYFLEMNTRLQVEHPVTEYITGLDLVEMMIRVAAGEKLPIEQKDVQLNGWSMESRVYAEDPFRNFMPSIGRLVRYQPPEGDNVRVDTGVDEGGEISMYYDPMIAKLVTYGDTRDDAIAAMRHALDGYVIKGVEHNISFLAALMAHPRFQKGDLTTNFIAEEYPDGFSSEDVPHDDPHVLAAIGVCVHRAYQERAALISGQVPGHERAVSDDWAVVMKDHTYQARCVTADGGFQVAFDDDRKVRVRTNWKLGELLYVSTVDGAAVTVQVERSGIGYRLTHSGTRADVVVLNPDAAALYALMPEKEVADTSKFLLSPMPGLLVSVSVKDGQTVKAGDELAVVEAMKMENVLRAERDGIISKVQADAGDSLAVDQVILEFD